MKILKTRKGFTLIELMIVVAIIGILAAIAIPQFASMVAKSQEGATKGNLGTIRSALSIYYGDTEGWYPVDASALSSLTLAQKYLQTVPSANLPRTSQSNGHSTSPAVRNAIPSAITDAGGWNYDNTQSDTNWGQIAVSCTHKDAKGNFWTSY